MLRPPDISVGNRPVAVRPSQGYEEQLYVSVQAHTELGTFTVLAQNSGVYNANASDNAGLSVTPQEILAVLENAVPNAGASNPVLTVVGTDQDDAALTGTATFAVPAYSTFTDRTFPKGWANEAVVAVDGRRFKTITSVTIAAAAEALGVKLTLFGVPAVSTFRLIGCKVRLSYAGKTPMPVSIQCGRDVSAYVKPGEIPESVLNITAKVPTDSDGLSRINGIRVTGLIKQLKEDVLLTAHKFFLGLVLTARHEVGESVDPTTLEAEGRYEDYAVVLPQ